MRVYEHLDLLRDEAALRPWIAQVARRVCADHLRRRRSSVEATVDVAAIDARLERLDETLTVWEALRTLPERCRQLLDRRFCRDESYEAIAAAMRLPAGTVASGISRCLEQLRARLGPVERAAT